MANILTKERIDTELKINGKLEINGDVWNTCKIPITKDEHVLAVLDMYDYRDAGIMKLDSTVNAKFFVGGTGISGTEMDGYLISLFSDCAYLSKIFRKLI
jgi:hypothetical protein